MLVVGRDVGIERVLNLVGKTLVGFSASRRVSLWGLSEWMRQFWMPMLGYCPRSHLLFKGWLGFVFVSEDDVAKNLATQWWLDSSILSLNVWSMLFDPSDRKD